MSSNKMGVKNAAIKANANCNQVILDHFWHICQSSEEKRCRSVRVILHTLGSQVASGKNNDIAYCLNRLVRGLVSAREFARHGFCVLLTEMLTHFPEQIDIVEVIAIANKEYDDVIRNSNPENVIAWTLLIGCLLKSERITADTEDEILLKLFGLLFKLGYKKIYVELIVCSLMSSFYDIFTKETNRFEAIVLKSIKNLEDECSNTIFLTYLIVLAHQKYPTKSTEYFPKYMSQCVYKANSKDFTKIISLYKESTKYHPNIHPLVELLNLTIYNNDKSNFILYAGTTLDEILKISLEKTSLGFELVRIFLNFVRADEVEVILSSNFMRIFIQTLSNTTHPLYQSAIILGNHIVKLSSERKEDSDFQVALARCFINKPGSINFDELSKSKILSNVLKQFSNQSIHAWISLLKELMLEQETIPPSDFYRIRCLQQMSQLLKSYSEDDGFLRLTCKFLLVYSYFDINQCKDIHLTPEVSIKRFKASITQKLHKQFSDSFKTTFAHLCHLSSSKPTTATDKLQKHVDNLEEMYEFIQFLLTKKKIQYGSSGEDMLPKLTQTIGSIGNALSQISGQSIQANVFRLLYLHFTIEVLENMDEINSILPDFIECSQRALSLKKSNKGTEPLWCDVLVELFLSMLTTRSKHTSNVINMAFRHISPFITLVGIQTLLDAIMSQDALKVGDDSDDEESESEDVDNEEESQAEVDEEDEFDEEDNLMEEDGSQVDERFRQDVINALGSTADNAQDSDGDLSDSEMFKIDQSLAEVFRKKFGEKKLQAEKAIMMVTFRNRALELIQILVDHHLPSLEIVLQILTNVVTLTRANYAIKNQSALTNRCVQLILHISKNRNFTDSDKNGLCEEQCQKLLGVLMDFLYRCTKGEVHKALVSACAWLMAISYKYLPATDYLRTTLERALTDFFERANIELKPSIFEKLIPQWCDLQHCSFVGSCFYNTLLLYCFKEDLRYFKRCSATDLLCSLLKTCPVGEQASRVLEVLATKCLTTAIAQLTDTSTTSNTVAAAKQPKKTNLQYINSNLKLLNAINVCAIKSTESARNALISKLDALPKECRNKLDKNIVRKMRNAV